MPNQSKLRLSYSKCETFLKCRERYRLCYEENLVPRAKSVAPSIGIVCHHLLFLNNKKLLDKTPMSDLYAWAAKEFPDMPQEQIDTIIREAAFLVNGYLASLKGGQIEIISPEVSLEKDYGDFSVYARLDGLCRTPDQRVWRLEYKTTAKTDSIYLSGLRKGLQTGISLMLAEDLLDTRLAGTVFSLLVKTKVPQYPVMAAPRDRWVIDYARKCCEGIARSIERHDFYPSLDCHTWYECDYRPICSSGGNQQIKETFFKPKEVPNSTEELTEKTDN